MVLGDPLVERIASIGDEPAEVTPVLTLKDAYRIKVIVAQALKLKHARQAISLASDDLPRRPPLPRQES